MNQDLEPKRAGTHLEPASIKRTHLSRLPIGDTDIASVIHSGYYADKTKLVGKLLLEGKTSFLVRPRRFGKSLFVNTIAAIAEGANKELFKDCFISNGEFEDENGDIIKYDWKKYPVIRLDFSKLNNKTSERLEKDIKKAMYRTAKFYGIDSNIEKPDNNDSIQSYYIDLVEELKTLKKGYESKIVLLIDEYDSPVINLDWNSQNYKDCMKVLSDFFATVKSCANDCQLIFVTGVYKFVLSGLGSGANILHDGDISLDENVSDIVGYREEDIRALFKYNFDKICDRRKEITGIDQSTETVVKDLKEYYNGYRFSNSNKEPDVFNPTSILHFFKSGELLGYWKDTADTRLLVKQMQDNIERFSVDKIKKSFLQKKDGLLETTSLKELDIIPLMYQTGYLTIKSYDPATQEYTLKFPNKEVEQALSAHFEKYLVNKAQENGIKKNLNVKAAFKQEDWQKLFSLFRSDCYAKASYELTEKSEKYFHGLLFMFLNGVFLDHEHVSVAAETISNIGQTDIVIKDKLNDTIYIFELKLNKDSYTGLKQISDRDYYGQYINTYKKIVCIGLNIRFNDNNKNHPDPSHRNIDECALLIRRRDDNNNWEDDPIKKFAYSPTRNNFSESELSKDPEIYNTKTRSSRRG